MLNALMSATHATTVNGRLKIPSSTKLGWAPLGWQAFLRLRQVFLARLNV